MIKKLLLLALLIMSEAMAEAGLEFTYNYNRTNFTCVVTGHYGTPTRSKVYIPLGIGYPGETANYKVVGIEPNALNDLVGVDTIVIPNTIEYIGYIYSTTSSSSKFADIRNFKNCPDLSYIQVAEGNKVFKSTGAGILTSADGKAVYRVPPRINVTKNNGTLKMAATGTYITEHAFDGNTTVRELVLSKNLEYIHPDCGIRNMPALEALSYAAGGTAENTYMVDNNALITKSDKTLRFYPPACPEETYIVTPINVSVIGAHAFANTTALKEVIVPEGPRTTGNYAFENSSVEKVTFPSTLNFVTNSGYGAFKNSKIKELIWNGSEERDVPRDFMLGCTELTTVSCEKPFNSIGASAFRNCVKLKNVPPFDVETAMTGDSIWANTGLESVIYQKGEREKEYQYDVKAVFAGCKHLERIDFSNYSISTDRYRLKIWESFAAGCDSLQVVYFPGFISLDKTCFAGCPNLKKLVIKDAEIEEGPIFTYNSDSYVTLQCFVKVPENCGGAFTAPVNKLFHNEGKGQLIPTFYFEATESTLQSFLPHSINYIPAASRHRYPNDPPYGSVYEMFDFRLEERDGKEGIKFTHVPAVKITNVSLPNTIGFPEVPNDNFFELSESNQDFNYITVFYRVDGIPYRAGYVESQYPWNIQTGIEEVNASTGLSLNGRLLEMDGAERISIFDMQGREVLDCRRSEVDLSSLGRGLYIARGYKDGEIKILKFSM